MWEKKKKKKNRNKSNKKKKDMPAVCFSLKKSLHCKPEPSDVHDPTAQSQLNSILARRKPDKSRCSRSIANFKEVVIHGSKRHLEKPPNCSPRSIGSGDFLNPVNHQVIFSTTSKGDHLKINVGRFSGAGGGTPFSSMGIYAATPPRTPISASKRTLFDESYNNYNVVCHKCGDHFSRLDALESHHLSRHAVTELVEGDSSRKIVEIICRSSWMKNADNPTTRIDRILKVHNSPITLSRFEDYREAVKIRAGKLPKKHPRCLADGNELLRFHGTSISCPLGSKGSSSLCAFDNCNVCGIIRRGFSGRRGGVGVFTASTSGRAYKSVRVEEEELEDGRVRKALVVCRVIAGRVHRPVEEIGGGGGAVSLSLSLTGFDSLAGKVGPYSNIEELYLLNPRAILPCFVVICKA